ncbi:[FeFe] hydrogenase H-cluster radical SAM maturase HydE [Paludibacterium purpuratum]|uniref:Biotin synthase n=1 Tax=Paludibacterium purpuratum TaxID=1144873 RepID=A0A4R7AW07_9NEIS|nr:[FeFe] hydrogenase H-cluster radical SAM maturase HydE [Paludibacterium purpuratum]TDR71459.1 biotin synthase [Paludibacterium purpuratum]
MVAALKADIERIVQAGEWQRDDLVRVLGTQDAEALETLRAAAEATLLDKVGAGVSLRGLIEFSNVCISDCLYCGIRKHNRKVERYTLTDDEIVASARWCAEMGYGSVVLQSGERRDAQFIDRLAANVRAIKQATRSARQPDGVGITLCVGEQSRDDYQRLFDAGAHRYLLRMETSSPELFALIHPAQQRFETRLQCLKTLREVGFQVGTGVMIGIPGQTLTQLADDLLFFRSLDIDMLGMGPYIPHGAAAMPASLPVAPVAERLDLAFKMIALARLTLGDVNIAATTALQALDPVGRERGLRFGANVIMPQVTPLAVRKQYTLYDGKPCLEDSAGQCATCLEGRIASVNRFIRYHHWGDSVHFARRNDLPVESPQAPAVPRHPNVRTDKIIQLHLKQD